MTQDQSILMCPPDYYGVDYVINAWMEGQCGKTDRELAHSNGDALRAEIEKWAKVEVISAQPGLPDMVFGECGVGSGQQSGDPAVFRAKERQGEEPHFLKWFKAWV